MTEEIVEGVMAALRPVLLELKQGLTEMEAELKEANSRHDLRHKRHDDLRDQVNLIFNDMKADMHQRFERVERRIREVHEDVREVRSYVWTGGYEKAKAERQSAVLRENQTPHGSKEQPGNE